VFAGAFRDAECADYFEALRGRSDQSHVAGIFIAAVKHAVGVDNRAFVGIPAGV
jgi:hypothetical protein